MDFKERKSLPLPRQFLCGQEREKIGCVAAYQVSGVKGIFLDNGKLRQVLIALKNSGRG